MEPRVIAFRGRVCAGRGLASDHLANCEVRIAELLKAHPQPGSLNVALNVPLKLVPEEGFWLDREGGRMAWRGRLNGRSVLLYRWMGCPFSILEVISDAHLRSELGLDDSDVVVVEVEPKLVTSLTGREWLGWLVLWMGRSRLYYKDRYANGTISLQLFFDRKISGKAMIDRLLKRVLRAIRNGFKSFMPRAVPDLRRSFVRGAVREGEGSNVDRLLNVLAYTKTSGSAYSAERFPAGYHTLQVDGVVLEGQRLPSARLDLLPISLEGLSVLDIGSNQGGMLFEAQQRGISWGVGIDYDSRMVNAANKVKQFRRTSNLDFFVFNLDEEQLPLLGDFLPQAKVDLVLLLSVCMWVDRWREVVAYGARIAPSMLFESNGTPEQQDEQQQCLEENFKSVDILQLQSVDDRGQLNRKLFFCRN